VASARIGCGVGDQMRAAVFVAQVERFAARIADRVVVPGRQAELVRVLAPGVRRPALRHHACRRRIGQHVHPRRGRDLPGRERDHVLAPVGGETAKPLHRIRSVRGGAPEPRECPGLSDASASASLRRGRNAGSRTFAGAGMVELLGEGAARIGEHDPRDRLQQDAVLAGDLLGHAHEDTARPVDHARAHARGDQTHDFVLQALPVANVLFVPDHQIHRQPLQPPVGMGLHQLADEIEVGGPSAICSSTIGRSPEIA
jgi:hypothetical protein